MKRIAYLSLCLLPALAAAEVEWMSVVLDGRKIGHAVSERSVEGDRVETSMRMALSIERNGIRIDLESRETSIETVSGEPLAIAGETALGGVARSYSGTIVDGVLKLETRAGALVDTREIAWPEGAVLAEGQRLALESASLEDPVEVLAFLPDVLQAGRLSMRFGEVEQIDMPEVGRIALRRTEQTLDMGGHAMSSVAWIDDQRRVRRLSMPVFGTFIEMLVCSRACALAPVQPSDIFERTLAAAPETMAGLPTRQGIRYRIRASDDEALTLPSGAEQRVRSDDAALLVEVRPGSSLAHEPPPDATLAGPNRWIESDAGPIREMAARLAGKLEEPDAVMRRLERGVRRHVATKSLRVGYASALETLHSAEGDCTEHALLLAALGRARGIPTRIATGLVYAETFGTARNVFVPHAWTQAWIGDRWVSFDAAQEGFGSGHILLGVGDGEPWRFYEGVGQLGRLHIEQAERIH